MRSFLIRSNLWVGLAVSLLSLLSFPEPWNAQAIFYALFIFFATVSAYSYMRWVKLVQGNYSSQPKQIPGLENDVLALGYSLITGIVALAFLRLVFQPALLWALTPAFIIAVLYPIAFKNPNRHFSSLRTIPMLKLLLISVSWSWLSFGMPMVLQSHVWSWHLALELLFRTFLIAGLTIPFDVRDLDYDRKSMRTLPQMFGIGNSLVLANLLLLTYQLWIVMAYFVWRIDLPLALAWIIGLEVGAWLIRKVEKDRSEWFVGFWIEGIPIWVFILYLLINFTMGNY